MKKETVIKYSMVATPLIMAVFYFLILFYQAERVAITDDARFYMDAAKSYSTYFESCSPVSKCFEKAHIDKYWRKNNEHPPFAKLLMASGYFVFHRKLGWLDEIRSLRIGISVFAAIVLLFLFSFTAKAFSFRAAVFASLSFIFLPRTFFHARVATLDFAVLGTSFIFIYCYWMGFKSKFWAWMTGAAFGVALSTKLNAPFMLMPVLVHYFVLNFKNIKTNWLKTLFPTQFISMLLISLPLFFAMWPWLWHSTFERFAAYVKFHTFHYGILMYYLGEIFSEPRPPWHAPWVMMVLTTPLVTLFFSHVAVVIYRWKEDRGFNSPMLLVILSAVISIAVLMFMPAPFYSGVKLFQPFFPFLCIMAGFGIYETLKKLDFMGRYRFAPAVFFFVPVILSMVDLKHDHLSYYNELAGGTKGAAKYGMETQYYDLFYWDLTQFFNRECEKKVCKVSFEPNPKEYKHTSNILKNSGYLTKNFRFCQSGNCDYYVLTHEYRWKNYPYLLRDSKGLKQVFSIQRQGVELLTVFKLSKKEGALKDAF
jgi:4-amino-4-deoxy-L-arabinose transferase-like glycosyltransferase